MEKEYVIGLNRGVDTFQFWKDVETITNLDNIPNRAVEVANARSGSNRLTHYYLTDEEAEIIRQDERVYVVEIPADQRDDIQIGLNSFQSSNFTRFNNFTGSYDPDDSNGYGDFEFDATGSAKNWGLLQSRFITTGPWTSSISGPPTSASFDTSGSYYYNLDGTGVDVVIQDSGIQADHPEFQDENGNSRLQEINWYTESGISGTQPANLYTDYDGHGTHCAGIAVGKTFGWGKNARIYAQKLAGLEGDDDPGTGIPIADAFDTIKLWHANKSGSRPTVVNMSWGYGATPLRSDINNYIYRGTSYTSGNQQFSYGIMGWFLGPTNRASINVRVSSVDIDIEEMIDAGIHVVIAAGNRGTKIEVEGGTDYYNRIQDIQDPGPPPLILINLAYHQGSSPYSENAIIVGAIDAYYYPTGSANLNTSIPISRKAYYSNCGPGVDIYAPGSQIMSAMSITHSANYTTADYYEDGDYKQGNLSGTSMASPQVAGMASLMLQISPNTPPNQLKSTMLAKAHTHMISGSIGGNIYDSYPYSWFSDQNSGSMEQNKVLYNYLGQNPIPYKLTGPLTISANLTTV